MLKLKCTQVTCKSMNTQKSKMISKILSIHIHIKYAGQLPPAVFFLLRYFSGSLRETFEGTKKHRRIISLIDKRVELTGKG